MVLVSSCTNGPDCAQTLPKSEDGYVPSAEALKTAGALSSWVTARASQQLKAEQAAARDALQSERVKAEEAYQAAKARKERPKPVPRATLHINENIAELLPKYRYESLIAEFYAVENGPRKSFFVRDGQLTPQANALLAVLDRVDEHALNIDDFAPDQLRNVAQRLVNMRDSVKNNAQFNPFEIEAISRALDENSEKLGQLEGEAQVDAILAMLCDFDTTPVPRAAALCARTYEHLRDIDMLEDALEFALADAWFVYARDLKLGNLEKFSDEERQQYTTEENPNDIHPKYHDRIIETRLAAAMQEFQTIEDENAAATWLNDLVPKHEQYPKLQQIREKYRQLVADGGWAVVPPDRMFAGGHAPLVKNLKDRLAKEGYYKGTVNDLFDRSLTDAIKKYQKHHQLEETGEVDEVFWRSLNVPADQRLAEIEVNIRRWHKTLFEARDTYVYINIPSFSVEFWADGEHKSTHRAVVGSSTKICNTKTQEWELMNSTRLMHSRMTYLVYNPYWNVPPRIEVDEFWPKINADPKWLGTTDYEFFTPKGGGRVLRQKPGPNNALGRVKLIFPNRYNIYLHDTPKQGMFNYPVRAFSHGCIRVEGATKFAKAVLEHDGQWDKKMVDRFLKSQTEHPIDLKTPIDVFIEYHTVTVDEEGEPYFLADIYKIIKNEIDPPTALERHCNPSTDRTSSYRSGAGEDSGP